MPIEVRILFIILIFVCVSYFQTQARLGTAATITYGGAFDEAYLRVIISTLSPGNGVILILNEHSVIFIQVRMHFNIVK